MALSRLTLNGKSEFESDRPRYREEAPLPAIPLRAKRDGRCANPLGLDTRSVCRGAYEKSTQAFISHMDPELRFLRSYSEIRPYSDHRLFRDYRS